MQRSNPFFIFSVGIKSVNLYDGVFMGARDSWQLVRYLNFPTVQQSVTHYLDALLIIMDRQYEANKSQCLYIKEVKIE